MGIAREGQEGHVGQTYILFQICICIACSEFGKWGKQMGSPPLSCHLTDDSHSQVRTTLWKVESPGSLSHVEACL